MPEHLEVVYLVLLLLLLLLAKFHWLLQPLQPTAEILLLGSCSTAETAQPETLPR